MKKRARCAAIFLLCVCAVAGCTKKTIVRSEVEGDRISIIAIITKPEDYQGKRATVRGILKAEEEGIALYVAEEDAGYQAHISALWLGKFSEIQTLSKEELKAMDGKYVGVTGTIAAKKYGPTNDYNCEMIDIENVKAVEAVNVLPSPTT